ncbi:hypothetical protein M0R45_029027 [Rubus argutus]|uniref:Uncharacterized protein n=1 Tax=Rubus argutus TaxID=59490 RepID=A0AAW1W7T9_RUBAR
MFLFISDQRGAHQGGVGGLRRLTGLSVWQRWLSRGEEARSWAHGGCAGVVASDVGVAGFGCPKFGLQRGEEARSWAHSGCASVVASDVGVAGFGVNDLGPRLFNDEVIPPWAMLLWMMISWSF